MDRNVTEVADASYR
ncbi:hypothetical protein ACLK2F_04990 [Escherichia coli]